jgi:hypothetical protein
VAESPGTDTWNWRARSAERARADRRSRLHGLLQGLFVVAVAVVLRFGLRRGTLADIAFVAGVLMLLAALFRPHLLVPLRRGGAALGRAVAVALTWLLLVPFFLVFIVPGGILLRLRGRDPLSRGALEAGTTGWIPRRQDVATESLMRQFMVEDRAARLVRRPEGSPSDRAWPGPASTAEKDAS